MNWNLTIQILHIFQKEFELKHKTQNNSKAKVNIIIQKAKT